MATKKTELIEFKLMDRILINSIFETEGSYDHIILKDDIINKCRLSQGELDEYKVVFTDKTVSVGLSDDDEKNSFKIDLTRREITLIRESLENIERRKKLNSSIRNLYEIFVVNG